MARSRPTVLAAAVAVALLTSPAVATPALAAARAGPDRTASLDGVSCPRFSMCVAVGGIAVGRSGRTLAELWNGVRWRRLATPQVAGANLRSGLRAVSCTSRTRCVAVGDVTNTRSFVDTGIIERWDGSRWRRLLIRIPAGTAFRSVSCAGRSCMIVGAVRNGRPAAMQLAGDKLRSRVPPVPWRGSVVFGWFSGVYCTAPNRCMAVGTSSWGAFAESWNGTRWRITGEWKAGVFQYQLDSVACASATRCLAVGAPVAGIFPDVLLTVLWQAGRWHKLTITGRQIAGHPDVPDAVSCAVISHCVATEYGLNNGKSAALTWDGGSTLRVHPVTHPALGELYSISCAASRRCVAVGGLAVNSAATRGGALAELWNGRAWRLLPVTG